MSIDDEEEKILLDYPALICETIPKTNTRRFVGNVRVQHTPYRITLSCPQFPSLLDMQLRLQQGQRVINLTAIAAGVQSDWTFSTLIEQLPKLLPSPLAKEQPLAIADISINLYDEIAQLKSDAYTIHINVSCSHIRFSKFQQFPEHFLELRLPTLQLLSHSLPDCAAVSWHELLGKCTTLKALLELFVKQLEELREFYAQFVDIDELCYVVQPAEPSTKHNWRLFSLRERVFLKLIIADPFAPVSSMKLHIIGPTHEVEVLRRCYSEGLKEWDAELDIHKNLLRIFDLCFFPMPPGSTAIGMQPVSAVRACNICYCHQLEGQVPIVSCDNPSCSLIYHAACLREWFSTLSDGKTFLDVSFGACPFCKAKLSTSFDELLTI